MWQAFAIFTLDASVLYLTSRPVFQSVITYEAKILSFSRIDRSIPSSAGLPQTADAILRIADESAEVRQLLTDESYRLRTVDIRLVNNEASPILNTPPIFSGEMISMTCEIAVTEVALTDRLFSWLDEDLPKLVTHETVMMGVTFEPLFAPIIVGINEQPEGALQLERIPATDIWVLAATPVESVVVFRRTSADDMYVEIPSTDLLYEVTQVAVVVNGVSLNLSFIHLFDTQIESTEIRVNVHGINFRGAFGDMPEVTGVGVLRNPIDFLANMSYFFLAKHGVAEPSSLFATASLAILRERFEFGPSSDLSAYCDGIIRETLTAREFLSRFLTSFELVVFQRQTGAEVGKIDVAAIRDSDVDAMPVGEGLIRNFREYGGSKTINEVLYRYDLDHISNSFAAEQLYANSEEQRLSGVGAGSPMARIGKASRETVDYWYVRDGSSAFKSVFRRLNFKSIGSHRQTFELPLPEVFPIELARSFLVTHRMGLQFGGYRGREVKTLRTTYDLDNLVASVETIVLEPLLPEIEGTDDIIQMWYDVDGEVSAAAQRYRESFAETPNGAITTFTLPEVPIFGTERLFINGVYQIPLVDYIPVGNETMVFFFAPITGDILEAFYDVAGTGNLSRSRTIPTGTINGTNSNFDLPETPVTDSERVYVGSMNTMVKGVDYEMSTPTRIHFLSGVPQVGDSIYVFYDVVGTRRLRRHRVTPIGPINNINPIFFLRETPAAEEIFVNSIIQFPPADYALSDDNNYLRTFYPPGSIEIQFTNPPRKT